MDLQLFPLKAAKNIENGTSIQQWRGLRSQPPDPQSFDVGSNVLAMRDSLDLSLSGFRRRLKVPQLPCNGSAARTSVYPVFFDAKKRLKARFLTRTELLWNRPLPMSLDWSVYSPDGAPAHRPKALRR